MICPRCATRNALGQDRCERCGHAFTHRAARRSRPRPEPALSGAGPRGQQASRYAAVEPQRADYAPERRGFNTYRESSLPGSKAIGGMFALLILIIAIIGAASLFSTIERPESFTSDIGERVGNVFGLGGSDQPSVEVPQPPSEPAGETTWVLTEDELNQRISARAGSFGPASNVRVELNEGIVTVRFRAYGVNGTYHGSLTTQDGVPVIADSTIDGPIGWVVGSSEIDAILNEEIANAVSEQNIFVDSVHVQPGQVVFGITGA
jgi:hypothetical protein